MRKLLLLFFLLMFSYSVLAVDLDAGSTFEPSLSGTLYVINTSQFGISNVEVNETCLTIDANVYCLINNGTVQLFVTSDITSLTFDKTSPQTFGTNITPICNLIQGFGSPNLTLNGSLISNNTPILLGAGNWLFNCSTGSYSNTSIFVINKASSSVQTFLNNNRANLAVFNNSIINMTGKLIIGVGNISLYRNSTLLQSGSSPQTNFTNYTTTGVYNLTTIYEGNQNYTSSFETWLLTVNPFFIPSNRTTFKLVIGYHNMLLPKVIINTTII